MGLFSKNPEKQEQEAAARAELDRLGALGPDALAVEILPVIGSGEPGTLVSGVRTQDICKALVGKVPMSVNPGVLLLPAREAMQRLEHANLVMQMSSNIDNATRWRITTAGEQALVDNNVAQKLA